MAMFVYQRVMDWMDTLVQLLVQLNQPIHQDCIRISLRKHVFRGSKLAAEKNASPSSIKIGQ